MKGVTPYPKYCDSGREWLGNIPVDWEVIPVKYLCSFSGGGTPSKDNPNYWSGGDIPWVSPKDMKTARISDTMDHVTTKAVAESSTGFIEPGALLMVVRSGILQRTIPVAISDTRVTLNQDMKALAFNLPQGAEYFSYLVQGHTSALRTRWIKEGATVESIEHEYLANDIVPNPTAHEIASIIAFLDHETARIDRLIEKQQQFIALLKEKRQAVISHAVTKGLNPNAPLKDSGIEWLGQVPAHWEVKRIKHYGKIEGGFAFKSGDFTDDGVRAIKIANVSHLTFDWKDSSYLPASFLSGHAEYVPPCDSLVFAMTRPIISGGVKVAKFCSDEKCLVNQRVGFFRPSKCLNQDFLMYVAQSKSFFCLFENNITATNQPNISSEGIEDIRFGCPDLVEQESIVNYIEHVCELLERTTDKAIYQIELLQERRTALISAAVTGKIDVRGWKPDGKAEG